MIAVLGSKVNVEEKKKSRKVRRKKMKQKKTEWS